MPPGLSNMISLLKLLNNKALEPLTVRCIILTHSTILLPAVGFLPTPTSLMGAWVFFVNPLKFLNF